MHLLTRRDDLRHCNSSGTRYTYDHYQPEWSALEVVGAVTLVTIAAALVFVPHVMMAAGTGSALVGVGTKMLAAAFGNSGSSCGP